MESDGFVLVKSKRKRRKKDSCKAKGVTLCQDGWTSATADKIDRSISLVPVEGVCCLLITIVFKDGPLIGEINSEAQASAEMLMTVQSEAKPRF